MRYPTSPAKESLPKRRPDGFATLTGSMMERRITPAPRIEPGPPIRKSNEGAEGRLPKMAVASDARTDRYEGPERRHRDVSPVIERRRAMPPRVKVSVRLESHRHNRLKAAALLLERTHQDLMTSALDHYLDLLNIPVKYQWKVGSAD